MEDDTTQLQKFFETSKHLNMLYCKTFELQDLDHLDILYVLGKIKDDSLDC